MSPFNKLTGKLFGSLRVIVYAGTDRHGRRKWRVGCCRCGREKIVLAANLLAGLKPSARTSGRTRTCGCVQREKARQRMRGYLRVAKVIGPAAMEGFAWEGADEHLDRLAARIPGGDQMMVRLLPSRSRVHAATAQ
jgi:hypothetical protein